MAIPTDIDDAVFDSAYERALSDAVGQGADAGTGQADGVANLHDCLAAEVAVRTYVEGVAAGDSPCFFKAERAVERALRKHLATIGGETITFGNAQELISMTAAYVYAATCEQPGRQQNFACCKCPMDDRTLAAVVRLIGLLEDAGLNETDLSQAEQRAIAQFEESASCGISWRQLERAADTGIVPSAFRRFQEAVCVLASRRMVLDELGVPAQTSRLSPLEFGLCIRVIRD